MTYNRTSFDAYHWLPEENPANIIEIPTDEEDNTHTSGLPYADPVDEAPQETEPSAEAKAASTAFRDAIRRSMPVYLMSFHVREYLRGTAVPLLEMAICSGVELAAVSIDDNGLPTWPGLHSWDPEAHSLHHVLQARLFECRDVEAVVNARRVLPALVQLGNERLAEAVALDLRLSDLTIGLDLLPTWGGRDGDEASVTTIETGSSVHSDDMPPPWSTAEAEADRVAAEEEAQLPSAWSSDTDSSDADAAPEPASECDDEVSLFNFVNENPTFEELSGEVPLTHIIHDVEVYGAASVACGHTLDFGVYLARDDDSDVDELPEVELAVDEETFAHHYHLADAIDVELAGEGIYCVIPRGEAAAAEVAEKLEEVSECTMDSTEEGEEGSSANEPVTPTSAGDGQVQTDWIVL
ncbi:hypothetical protein ISF_01497 [Cordyceps fumosorosea ARSEF 2679]|uniref:Uncharacterized protein n=1 Tax=Cordyceps fumosorosea (strain ARSEF 2679) TaxID=1081104 RepID=A0A162LLL2_CORFA|nr:hypothetical protein ISF_01497 [Cordyceps fumosorosea ARSEF 2679]OAA72424.1 hypothetical protein ISF_01497 [Cordyceps fumosorosea ARSEF 2679]